MVPLKCFFIFNKLYINKELVEDKSTVCVHSIHRPVDGCGDTFQGSPAPILLVLEPLVSDHGRHDTDYVGEREHHQHHRVAALPVAWLAVGPAYLSCPCKPVTLHKMIVMLINQSPKIIILVSLIFCFFS